MPVSVLTDVITWIEMIAQIGVATVELGVLSYLVFDNGWLDMIRLISFWCDRLIIKYIDKFYSYFDKILNGQIFAPDVVERVMNSVYLLVAVVILFRLIMLFMKYVINPEMVQDDKIGTASLVKRVIIGMCLMLFLNTIFTMGYKLQSAILTDNLFGQILLTKSQLRTYEKNKNQMGRLLAFNVYQGFWNLDSTQVNDNNLKTKYKNAITAKDPGVFGSINQKYGDDYAIDYFPVLSTVVLFYVLYLIIKYCIDIVVRMFKLFVLQMLGPIAITDYMVNGESKDMFKSWVKTTIAAYTMLFMRVFCIWFVAFITTLMNAKCTTVGSDGVCTDSMLYLIEGQDPDYLLRALITLGLLAFLMDLPKLLSEIFGLDLEQDASVKGLMQKVGGAAKMLGMGAMAAGGAAIGGAVGGMKNAASVTKNASMAKAQNKANLNKKIGEQDPAYAKKMSDIQNNKNLSRYQKSREMNKAQKDWLKQDKASTKTAREETKTKNQAAMAAWKDAGGKKSGVAKPKMEAKPQRSAIVQDYKRSNAAINRSAATQIASGVSDFAGGTMKAFASQIPGLREATNSYSQAAGPSLAQQNLSGRPVGMPAPDYDETHNLIDTPAEEMLQEVQAPTPEPETIAGVEVSAPNEEGERTTKSGIILPGSVDVDNKQ